MTIPRTLTADDNVPIGSIIVDNDGDAYQLRGPNEWHMAWAWGQDTHPLQLLIEHYGPITLIWEPPTTKDN